MGFLASSAATAATVAGRDKKLVFSHSAAARRLSALYGKLPESERCPRKACALVFTGFDCRLYDTFLKDFDSNM